MSRTLYIMNETNQIICVFQKLTLYQTCVLLKKVFCFICKQLVLENVLNIDYKNKKSH